MRLQKQLSRKSASIAYPKWVVVIPPKEIEKAGWKEGQELEVKTDKKMLILKKKASAR